MLKKQVDSKFDTYKARELIKNITVFEQKKFIKSLSDSILFGQSLHTKT